MITVGDYIVFFLEEYVDLEIGVSRVFEFFSSVWGAVFFSF